MPLSDDQLISLVRRDDLLSPEQVRQAREASRMTGKPLLDIIRERGWLDDAEMAHVEAAAAIVRPAATPAGAGQSATFIGSLAMLADGDAQRPTTVPGLPTDREGTVMAPAEADRPTAAPAMRGATPKPTPRRPASEPAAGPEAEPPMNRGVLFVAAILAAAIVVAMIAGLGKFVRAGSAAPPKSAPSRTTK
ncbi:MAG: hypothetical protein AAB074_15930 [Planctomycetota bacterium]